MDSHIIRCSDLVVKHCNGLLTSLICRRTKKLPNFIMFMCFVYFNARQTYIEPVIVYLFVHEWSLYP